MAAAARLHESAGLSSSASSSSSSHLSTTSDGDSLSSSLSCIHLQDKSASPSTPRASDRSRPPLFVCEPFVHRQLVQGKWKTIVNCPKAVDQTEWIAIHLHDFYRNLSLVYEVVNSSGRCTTETCPAMSIGPNFDCAWAGAKGSKAAPLFFDAVLTWIEKLLNDQALFPTQTGRMFNDAFTPIAKRVWACLADLWSHLYFAHYGMFLDLSLEAYTNSLIAHFTIFGMTHNLVAKQAAHLDPSQPKGHIIGALVRNWSRLHIVPRELRFDSQQSAPAQAL